VFIKVLETDILKPKRLEYPLSVLNIGLRGVFVEHLKLTKATFQSVTKIISLALVNLVTP
jgi:hypothetical protein